ncbi:MAG: ATP-binding cassette domain-containing protein [Candidatus Desulfofervidaceae bacterium]|nr:ATP-binding cassette domain-containing protein [Candidatus Desulfofervidaceae bacterium]MDL1970319.1 ATP-binding cassette domain-containing protein [Candidatus Desulfofervidaceae bacterium]
MQTVIKLSHVTLFRESKIILNNISWTVQKGEQWAIVGANGAGKSSLLHIISGYLWPSKGKVEVVGQTYGRCDLRILRQKIGWLTYNLAHEISPGQKAIETVISGKYASIGLWTVPEENDYTTAYQLMQIIGCNHLEATPFGKLSQGEKQKVLICRALMAQPALLLLDEPLAGLDLTSREKVLANLNNILQLSHPPTLILVTHHIEEIIPLFTHVLLLKNGEILAAGPKKDVLTDPLLSQTFGLKVHIQQRFGRFWIEVEGLEGQDFLPFQS